MVGTIRKQKYNIFEKIQFFLEKYRYITKKLYICSALNELHDEMERIEKNC